MEGFPWRLVTVDIDGTLTRGHGWLDIARAFGRQDDYSRSNRRLRAREIGEDEHLTDLLDIATGRTVEEVDRILDQTPRLDGIREALGELHRLGTRVALLTHNPDYVIDYYQREFGFDDGEGVIVPRDGAGRLAPPGSVRADKITGLHRLIARASTEPAHTAHIGDGWADVPVFREVGAGIALNSTLDEVNRAADRVLRTTDFREVIAALHGLPSPVSR